MEGWKIALIALAAWGLYLGVLEVCFIRLERSVRSDRDSEAARPGQEIPLEDHSEQHATQPASAMRSETAPQEMPASADLGRGTSATLDQVDGASSTKTAFPPECMSTQPSKWTPMTSTSVNKSGNKPDGLGNNKKETADNLPQPLSSDWRSEEYGDGRDKSRLASGVTMHSRLARAMSTISITSTLYSSDASIVDAETRSICTPDRPKMSFRHSESGSFGMATEAQSLEKDSGKNQRPLLKVNAMTG